MRSRPDPAGFTLVEVIVALTILAVGLLGCLGTLLAAQRALDAAERLHVATQSAADVADSLLAAGAAGSGRRDAGWGSVRWSMDAGGVRVVAEDRFGAPLLEWWLPVGGAVR